MSESAGSKRHSWLRALGRNELPPSVTLSDGSYVHVRTYKHDFFAATGLYEGPGGRVILKVGRLAPLFGLPMAWLGRRLVRREWRIYRQAQGVPGVPRCEDLWNDIGLVHEFVEGHPLQRRERVDDVFFDRLETMIDELHQRQIAYVDLEKRENILVDQDGRPVLIDFQIAWWWPHDRTCRMGIGRLLPDVLGRFILARLQAADCYHLLKHRRRHRPDQLTPEQVRASYRCGPLVRVHRVVSWPFMAVRRAILKILTGRSRSPKQDGPEFLEPAGTDHGLDTPVTARDANGH